MKKGHLITALIALGLFIWMIAHVGLAAIARQLNAMRIAFPIILALSLLRLLLQTFCWSASLEGENVSVAMPRLMGVRLASQAMGYLTVFGPAVSEPMKVRLLGTATQPTITGTLLDDGVYWFTSLLLTMAGIAGLLVLTAHSAEYRLVPTIALLIFLFIVLRRRSPILSSAVRALGARVPSWLVHAERIEASIRTYRLNQPALVRRMFCMDLACQVLIASEVFVVLWSLHLPIHFIVILAITGVTRTVRMLTGWIPARLGSEEGGAMSAFALAGFSPMLGLSLALTRRVRDLLWALIGILWLVWNSRKLSDCTETSGNSRTAVLKEVVKCRQ